jgi:hypothetical protein
MKREERGLWGENYCAKAIERKCKTGRELDEYGRKKG